MAKNVLISINDTQLNFAKLALQDVKNGIDRALKNAINNSLAATRKELYSGLIERYALRTPKTEEVKATRVIRAQHKPYSGSIRYSSKPLPLVNFKTLPTRIPMQKGKKIRQRKRIITEVRRGQTSKWNHAFLAKMKTGHIGIFVRVSNNRFPIRQKYSTSVPQMIGTMLEYDGALQAKIDQIADGKLNEQVIKILAKGK